MNHFSPKSLAFYGIAISSVLILFKTVSSYGENKLIAPLRLSGDYQIAQNQNLPNCFGSDDLILSIEQSGVYIFAELKEKSTETATNHRFIIPLSGKFISPQISLSGKFISPEQCSTSSRQQNNDQLITIEAKHQEKKISGSIIWNDNIESSFVAQLQKSPIITEKKH